MDKIVPKGKKVYYTDVANAMLKGKKTNEDGEWDDEDDDDDYPDDFHPIDGDDDDIVGELDLEKKDFEDKTSDELQQYVAKGEGNMLINNIALGFTTKKQAEILITEITNVLKTKIKGPIGTKTAKNLNKILNPNGNIKFINGNSQGKKLLEKKNALIVISMMENFTVTPVI